MRTNLLPLLPLAVLAVSGCAGEDSGPRVAPEVPASAPGDVLAADSTGLVCQWAPVEGGEGTWTVLCHREETTDDTADGGDDECICWYLVTYVERRGERIKVHEEFIGCENCNGTENCTEEQIAIDEEYDDRNYYNPSRRTPSDYHCSTFKDIDFTPGIGTHGHTVGLITPTYRINKPKIEAVMNGIVVTSDWRCPQGNANLPNPGSKGSWHMEGVGGDFAKSNRDTLTYDEWKELRDSAIAFNAPDHGISGYGWPCDNCPWQYKTHIHIDWRWQ